MATKKQTQETAPPATGEMVRINDDTLRSVSGFRHEERTNFRFDTGWDWSVLHDRAIASVERAVAKARMGELPEFSPSLELRVVVDVCPPEA